MWFTYPYCVVDSVHADPSVVTLPQAMHALSDPVRLQIVALLAEQGEMECSAIYEAVGISKTNASHHFKTLRGAALVWRDHQGQKQTARLRREAFEDRFPGLLDAVLRNKNAVTQSTKDQRSRHKAER